MALKFDTSHDISYFLIFYVHFPSILVSNMAYYRLIEAALKLKIVVNSLEQLEITSSLV